MAQFNDRPLPPPTTQEGMNARAQRMVAVLTAALSPSRLELVDESAQHAGHAGASAEGESHFALTVAASRLNGLSRLAQHRLVNDLLAEEFAGGLHALRLKILPA
jgi:BolA protein